MYSQVTLIGHLGNDPEMRFTPAGNAVTTFSVAVDRVYTKNEERVKETQWWRVTTWGRMAEACNQYLAKGSLVFVTGEPRLHTWDRQDGTTGASLEVTASQVKFLSRARVSEEVPEVVEDEIPF